MKPTTAVAISGGVDSLMAACLLKEQGHQVIGIHFITGFEADSCLTHDPRAPIQHPILDIGEQLGIPVETVDIRSEFQEIIVDYFTRTYRHGQTPNPCMRCNPTIKFGIILSLALERGAQNLATGHYAVIKKDQTGTYRLFKGVRQAKGSVLFSGPAYRKPACKRPVSAGDNEKSGSKKNGPAKRVATSYPQ